MKREMKTSVHAYTGTQGVVRMYGRTDEIEVLLILFGAKEAQNREWKTGACGFREKLRRRAYRLHLSVIYGIVQPVSYPANIYAVPAVITRNGEAGPCWLWAGHHMRKTERLYAPRQFSSGSDAGSLTGKQTISESEA